MRTATPATGKRSRQPRLRTPCFGGQALLRPRASESRPFLRPPLSQSAPIPPPAKTAASAPAALPSTAFSLISNRNKPAFKNPRNPMKIKAAPISNRNTNPLSAHPPQPAGRHSTTCLAGRRVTTHHSLITRLLSHVRGGRLMIWLRGSFRDAQIPLGPFVQHIQAPRTRPRRPPAQKVPPNS
jgi:hypothetical protein